MSCANFLVATTVDWLERGHRERLEVVEVCGSSLGSVWRGVEVVERVGEGETERLRFVGCGVRWGEAVAVVEAPREGVCSGSIECEARPRPRPRPPREPRPRPRPRPRVVGGGVVRVEVGDSGAAAAGVGWGFPRWRFVGAGDAVEDGATEGARCGVTE